MRFSEWTNFADIEPNLPTENGLFQIKVREGLMTYPNGKSAMFYYGYAENLNRALIKFRDKIFPLLEINQDTLLIRWMSANDIEARFQSYINAFFTEFGTMPLGNEMLLFKQAQQKPSSE